MENPIVIDFNYNKTIQVRKWSISAACLLLLITLTTTNSLISSVSGLICFVAIVLFLSSFLFKSKGHQYKLFTDKIVITKFNRTKALAIKEIKVQNIKEVITKFEGMYEHNSLPLYCFEIFLKSSKSHNIKMYVMEGKLNDDVLQYFKSKNLLV